MALLMSETTERRLCRALLAWFRHPRRVVWLESGSMAVCCGLALVLGVSLGCLFLGFADAQDPTARLVLGVSGLIALGLVWAVLLQVFFWLACDAFETNAPTVVLLRQAGVAEASVEWHLSQAEQELVAWAFCEQARRERWERRRSL